MYPHWLSARLKNPERVSLQEAYLAGQAYERRTWTDVFGHLGTPDEVGNEWHALSERLEAAESDGLEQARLLGMSGEREAALLAKLEAAEKERDALRAKIERMERQEPVAWMLNCQTLGGDTGWILSWTQSGAGLCNRLSGEENEKKLYALPVAQPAPSVPDVWLPVPEKHPTFDPVDLQLSDGSVLCGCLPQADGDYWWEGPSGEVFIDPKYVNVTHWRLAAAPKQEK